MNTRTRLADLAKTIRPKNAGADTITFDILFRERGTFDRVRRAAVPTPGSVCRILNIDRARLADFVEYDPACAVEFTIRRERPSGSAGDPDIGGAQRYAPFLDVEVDLSA